MKKTKRILTTLLAVIMLFGVVVIAAEAANLSTTKTNYGYMITTDAKISKAASTVKVYGNYDYINFYINSNYGDMYFFYEIYSDKKMTKMVASDYTYCESSGAYSWSPKIKLKGVFNSGTYYGVTYAAKIDGSGNAKISEPSLQQFKFSVNRKPEFKQQMVILKSVTTTVNGPVVKWSKLSNDVSKYVIYRRNLTGTKWTKVGTVKGSIFSFTDKSAKDKNGKFVYTVRALNKSGVGTRYLYNGLVCLFAKAPKISSVSTVSDNRIKVKWNKTADSAYYKVYRSENGGKWKTINSKFKGTTYYDTTAKNGKNYKYTVKAVIRTSYGNAVSAYHNVNKTVDFLNAPKLNPVTVVENGLSITWEKVEGATNYTVFRKTLENGAKWVNLGKVSVDVAEYVDTTANEESAFSYTIRADGKTSKGSYSNKGVEYIKLVEPEFTSELRENAIEVLWEEVPGATSYRVLHYVDNEWQVLETTNNTHCTIYCASPVTYKLSVQAVRGSNVSTYKTDVEAIEYYPPIYLHLSAYNEYNVIYWGWNESINFEKFNIYKKLATEDSSKYKLIYSGTEKIFSDTDVELDVAYTYTVKAVYDNVEQTTNFIEKNYTRYNPQDYIKSFNVYVDSYFNENRVGYDKQLTDLAKTRKMQSSVYSYIDDGNYSQGDYTADETYTFTFYVSDENGSTPIGAVTDKINTDYCQVPKMEIKLVKDGFQVSWNAVDGANKYILSEFTNTFDAVEVVEDGSGKYSVIINDADCVRENLKISLTAIKENGNRGIDEKFYYYSETPKLYKKPYVTEGSITISWDNLVYYIPDFYQCVVFRKAEGETKWTRIGKVKLNDNCANYNYTDRNVEAGKKYTYTVRIYDVDLKRYLTYYDTKGISAVAK
ncbi:MAG: hypothetical protein E7556_04400 [Ruminococcaceae bacterium]|nr:hypothetical protein [Oscillospiraceae bacterium]